MPGCSYPDWALCELSQAEPSFTAKTSPELAAGLAGWTGQMCADVCRCVHPLPSWLWRFSSFFRLPDVHRMTVWELWLPGVAETGWIPLLLLLGWLHSPEKKSYPVNCWFKLVTHPIFQLSEPPRTLSGSWVQPGSFADREGLRLALLFCSLWLCIFARSNLKINFCSSLLTYSRWFCEKDEAFILRNFLCSSRSEDCC